MEDTKKLIEKYKQELMELSRSSKQNIPPNISPHNQQLNFANTITNSDSSTEQTYASAQTTAVSDVPSSPDSAMPFTSNAEAAANAAPQNEFSSSMFDEPEPRQETVPQFPYHHEPEMPPPDYNGEFLPSNGAQSEPQDYSPTDKNDLSEPKLSDALTESADSRSPSEDLNSIPEINPKSQEEKSIQPFEPIPQTEPTAKISPDNRENGSKTQPPDYPQPNYSSYEEFEKQNNGKGTLIFQISTAQGALPIENAKCVLTKKFGGIIHEIKTLLTNESGKTEPLLLPAPPRSLSQQYETQIRPFALYDAAITRDGFVDIVLKDIPVFDGVQSVQRVSLLPEGEDNEVEIITEVNTDAR